MRETIFLIPCRLASPLAQETTSLPHNQVTTRPGFVSGQRGERRAQATTDELEEHQRVQGLVRMGAVVSHRGSRGGRRYDPGPRDRTKKILRGPHILPLPTVGKHSRK